MKYGYEIDVAINAFVLRILLVPVLVWTTTTTTTTIEMGFDTIEINLVSLYFYSSKSDSSSLKK